MLPKISVNFTKIELPSGKSVKIRPFLGYEEKLLLTAKMSSKDDGVADAVQKVISNCTEESIDDLISTDIEWLFLNLRAISVSPNIETAFSCSNPECNESTQVSFPVTAISKPEVKETQNKFEVGRDDDGRDIVIVLKVPTFSTLIKYSGVKDSETAIIFESLEGIYAGEEELTEFTEKEFADWLLSLEGIYSNMLVFMNSAPKVEFQREFQCASCGTKNNVHLKGIKDFFRS